MSLKITFSNTQNNHEQSGNVEWNETLQDKMNDLKTVQLITTPSVTFKTVGGVILSQTETFRDLGLSDGDRIFIYPKEEVIPPPPEGPKGGDVPPTLKMSFSKSFHQLGIFVLDGSYSMNDADRNNKPKKEALDNAMKGIISRMKRSIHVENFSFSIINFGESATEKLGVTPVKIINEYDNYDPTLDHNANTFIYKGLEKAEECAEEFLASVTPDSLPQSVVIILLSDGMCHNPEETKLVVNRIKRNPDIEVCTTFLETPEKDNEAAEELMQEIASKPAHFSKTYDEDSIRNFFFKSLSE